MADSSIGSVEVTPEMAKVTNIVFPESVDPDVYMTLSFMIEYGQGLHIGAEVYVHFFSSDITPDLPTSGTPMTLGDNHLCAYWSNGVVGWEALGGDITNFVGPVGAVTDGSDIPLGLDAKFVKQVLVGDWQMRILLKWQEPDFTPHYDWYTTLFQMQGYMELAINFATFDFGPAEQGSLEIPISTPLCGYLNMTITSNVEYLIQVLGTDPNQDGETFGVGNILANSVNDAGSAIPLSLILADLANLGSQPAGSAVVHRVYLWISIPVSASVGTYTFVLTVSVVPAA